MKTQAYLTVSRGGSVRTTKKRPYVNPDEVSIRIDIEIPNDYFQRPALIARIIAPDQGLVDPQEINVENVYQAIKEATGIGMQISVVDQSTEGEDDDV